MRRTLQVSELAVFLLVLCVPALADIHAVAAPETQTVAINGVAAQFDGSGSYTDQGDPPVQEWAWDFDGDDTDDYSENYNDPWGDGLTTYVYPKAGIFTAKLTVTAPEVGSASDTHESRGHNTTYC